MTTRNIKRINLFSVIAGPVSLALLFYNIEIPARAWLFFAVYIILLSPAPINLLNILMIEKTYNQPMLRVANLFGFIAYLPLSISAASEAIDHLAIDRLVSFLSISCPVIVSIISWNHLRRIESQRRRDGGGATDYGFNKPAFYKVSSVFVFVNLFMFPLDWKNGIFRILSGSDHCAIIFPEHAYALSAFRLGFIVFLVWYFQRTIKRATPGKAQKNLWILYIILASITILLLTAVEFMLFSGHCDASG
ncbi:MAG: hypothetical protein V1867_02515 [Candidatus Falkowbacteria bacterium]